VHDETVKLYVSRKIVDRIQAKLDVTEDVKNLLETVNDLKQERFLRKYYFWDIFATTDLTVNCETRHVYL
jgi:hypothetical protein